MGRIDYSGLYYLAIIGAVSTALVIFIGIPFGIYEIFQHISLIIH